MVDEVEVYIRDTAKRWNLNLEEKDREEARLHTNGKEAFSILAYLGEGLNGPVFWIANIGAGDRIFLLLNESTGMALADLERLDQELKSGLEEKFDIKLQPKPIPTDTHDV